MIVVLLVIVFGLVMFSSSKDEALVDMTDPRRTFSQLDFMAQQLRTSGPPLGRAVQALPVWISSSLSISGIGGKAISGKFNFGVGTGEV